MSIGEWPMRLFFMLFALLLLVPVLWPGVDLWVSGLFYNGHEFGFEYNAFFLAIHGIAYWGARVLAIGMILAALVAFARCRSVFYLDAKAWLFLLLSLIIGSGVMANMVLKDNWGRSRPNEIVEFGGKQDFSPALLPQFEKGETNGSFVNGDASFGFFFPAFAYVVPLAKRRRAFWLGMGAGLVFGVTRVVMGAHFLSDTLFAAALMLACSAALQLLMYGKEEAKRRWKSFFNRSAA